MLLAGLLVWVWLPSRRPSSTAEVENKKGAIAATETVDAPNSPEPEVVRTQLKSELVPVRSATITFVDELGNLVPGARLGLLDNGIERAIGISDDHASLSLEAASIEDKDCLARSDAHKTAWVHMPMHVETATVVLERLAGITGTVRLPDGSVPSEAFYVIAYPDKCPPLCEEIARPAEAKSFRCATTDSAGYFSITGLDPNRQYSLSGAGRGYALEKPLEHVAPGSRDLQLTALPLYGIRVLITDDEGQPLKLSPNLFSNQGGGFDLLDSSAKEVNFANELVLAKIDGVDCIENEDRDSFCLLYTSKLEKANVGPIAVTIERPGYKGRIESVRAPRLMDALALRTIQLAPDPSATGTVTIQLKLAGPAIAATGGVSLKGTKARSDIFLKLPRISAEPNTIEGVPCDEYTCVVRLFEGMLRIRETETGAPLRLGVLPNQTATLEVDLAKQSRINVILRDELGLSYEGRVLFRVIAAKHGGVSHITFETAPYCLVGLKEGSVSIAAMRGRAGSTSVGEEEFRVSVDLSAGEERDVVVNSRFQKRSEVR